MSLVLLIGSLSSLSARRAWIEMRIVPRSTNWYLVALRKESVDRNNLTRYDAAIKEVALRKESVDRNRRSVSCRVLRVKSLSARRAWIEIRMEDIMRGADRSLSARRAWIEI